MRSTLWLFILSGTLAASWGCKDHNSTIVVDAASEAKADGAGTAGGNDAKGDAAGAGGAGGEGGVASQGGAGGEIGMGGVGGVTGGGGS
ncbi:MAG: hypothetical protein H7X95_12090 [Deltaproteobacteria bacterium]|nr:hypothetical protein [Deltaproteobacteria bacterium]